MDIDIKELVKAAAEGFNLKDFKGDIVGVKIVENEFGNIEDGGIGIQINNGKDATIAKSDKDIKSAIGALLAAKDEKEAYLFQNKKQWWAVYRVLYYFCNYPTQMTAFETKMKELEVAKVDGKRDLSYESLSAAVKEVPLIATCSPATWNAQKDKSDNYKQQYIVADFLMQKLGIKS
jgi:hypothetical protein